MFFTINLFFIGGTKLELLVAKLKVLVALAIVSVTILSPGILLERILSLVCIKLYLVLRHLNQGICILVEKYALLAY